MNNPLLWTALWLVTVVSAFFVGQSMIAEPTTGDALSGDDERAVLLMENQQLKDELAAVGAMDPALGGKTDERPGESTSTDLLGRTQDTFALTGHGDADIALQEFLRYAKTMLARGYEGHLELLRTFDQITQSDDGVQVVQLFGNREQAGSVIYELLRFGVRHERRVVAMTETILREMAERPQTFEGIHRETLEVFLENVAAVMPAVMGRSAIGRLRGYVTAISLAKPKSLPKSMQRLDKDLARLLRAYAPVVSSDVALERLGRGELPGDQVIALLRRLTKEQQAELDLVAVAGPVLEEGNVDVLRYFSADAIRTSAPKLDPFVQRGISESKLPDHIIRTYLIRSARSGWKEARPFIERALEQSTRAPDRVMSAVIRLRPPPDSDWIRWAIGKYNLSPSVEKAIRAKYKLGN